MSWIESHQSLHTHKKLLRAATILKVNKYQLIGHLHALWWWGLDNAANDGALGDVTSAEIADAAGFPAKRAEEFTEALKTARFIDETPTGLSLHNWHRYAGKLNEKRAKDRARKSEVAGNSSGIPTEVAEKSQAPNLPTYLTNQPTKEEGARARKPRPSMAEVKDHLPGLAEEFPTVDVETEYAAAVDWLAAEGKAKKDYMAFMRNWLRRAASDPRRQATTTRPAAGGRRDPEVRELTAGESATLERLGIGRETVFLLD